MLSAQGTNVKFIVTKYVIEHGYFIKRVLRSYSNILDISSHSARAFHFLCVSRLTEYSVLFGVEFSLTGLSRQQTGSYIWFKVERHPDSKLKRN